MPIYRFDGFAQVVEFFEVEAEDEEAAWDLAQARVIKDYGESFELSGTMTCEDEE